MSTPSLPQLTALGGARLALKLTPILTAFQDGDQDLEQAVSNIVSAVALLVLEDPEATEFERVVRPCEFCLTPPKLAGAK